MARRTAATKRRRRGFTLVESLLACTVLALGVVSVGGVLAASHQHDRFTQEALHAAKLARDGVERASSAPLLADTGPVLSDYANFAELLDESGQPREPGDDAVLYARSTRVQFPSTLAGARGAGNLAIVTATVVTPGGKTATLRRLVVRSTFNGD
jgi:type II secretory pathway pseudopilin PulG